MKTLFLSSAGIVKETKNDLLELLGEHPKKTTVAFIPTAADHEKGKIRINRNKFKHSK